MLKTKVLIKGVGASKGIAIGRVRIVTGIDEFENFKDGEVLVARITDPSYVVLMSKAVAIISDMGGMLSHPAIVSREFGVPCVVGTQNATTILHDGQKVKVDGTKGIIYEAI